MVERGVVIGRLAGGMACPEAGFNRIEDGGGKVRYRDKSVKGSIK